MNDRELEELMREYEAEVAAYKRLPQAEPTALLDRAVLTKARAAVAHAPTPRQRPPRWIALAASFAGVAIAAGIGWRVYESRLSSQDDVLEEGAARGEVFEVEVLPSSRGAREKALEMSQFPPPPPPPPAAPAAPPAPVVATEATMPQAFPDALERKQELPAGAAGPKFAEEAPLAAAPAPAPAPQRPPEPEPHTRADHAMRAAAPEQRQNQSAPATSSVSGAGLSSRDSLGAVADEQRKRAESDADAEDGRLAGKDDADDPGAWLNRIRRLVRDRDYAQARAELARFRAAHPDIVIPMDLRRYAP